MASPVKPWENASNNGMLQNNARGGHLETLSSVVGGATPSTSISNDAIQGSGRPPIPPRPTTAQSPFDSGYGGGYAGGMGGYSGMGGMYSSPFMGGMSSFGPSYGRMGGYNSFGAGNGSFVNQAEASAEGAFQNVHCVVSAVSSISMMLESTYYALHNSFRAVIGVADQFSRLKVQLSDLVSSFALFKFIRWLYRRLQVLLGLRQAGLPEDAWNRAVAKSVAEAQERFPGAAAEEKKSSWPFLVFVGITVFLIRKILNSVSEHNKSTTAWADGTAEHVVGECKYDFTADKDDEISVQQGQRINLAPANLQPRLRENDWLLGCDGTKTGVVPASYIRILGTRKGKPKANQDNSAAQDKNPIQNWSADASDTSPTATSS